MYLILIQSGSFIYPIWANTINLVVHVEWCQQSLLAQFDCVMWSGIHTHTHVCRYTDTPCLPSISRHAVSRSFEVCLSWSSYVTGDTDPALHANPFVIAPLWCLSSLRSSSLPDLDQPGLAQFQGLHAKYGQDNVNKTVMFFLTTVQQQLEKC